MSKIKISDLHPTGSELFSNTENYMMDLAEYELSVNGGGTPAAVAGGLAVVGITFAASYIKGRFF